MDAPRETPESGKVERFAQLLATSQRRVFLYALSLVHNATDAEEILQETNLVLWRKFDEFQAGSDFPAWASRIAYYEVLKFRERRGRQELLFSGDFIEALAVQAGASMERADARRKALAQCLEKLSERDRQLVTQRYAKSGTTEGVALALGRSVQGTRKSLHRIRLALLACVQRTLAAEERA